MKMPTTQGTAVCPTCGEVYWYEFDCHSCEYTKISMCKCDRFMHDAEEFLKKKGLWEEFLKYHEEREKQYKRDGDGEETTCEVAL
jgi:hypothetical protein